MGGLERQETDMVYMIETSRNRLDIQENDNICI